MTKYRYYILVGTQPVAVSAIEWAQWFNDADRRIAYTKLNFCVVSTVFLGIDHRFGGEGPPLLFETMVFNGPLDQETRRYSTWEEAEAGHEAMVERVRKFRGGAR